MLPPPLRTRLPELTIPTYVEIIESTRPVGPNITSGTKTKKTLSPYERVWRKPLKGPLDQSTSQPRKFWKNWRHEPGWRHQSTGATSGFSTSQNILPGKQLTVWDTKYLRTYNIPVLPLPKKWRLQVKYRTPFTCSEKREVKEKNKADILQEIYKKLWSCFTEVGGEGRTQTVLQNKKPSQDQAFLFLTTLHPKKGNVLVTF